MYRYLYQPGEQHRDKKRRAADFILSKITYRLDRIVQDPGNRVLYYFQDGPDIAFVRKELMHVSEDTQVPQNVIKMSFSVQHSVGESFMSNGKHVRPVYVKDVDQCLVSKDAYETIGYEKEDGG